MVPALKVMRSACVVNDNLFFVFNRFIYTFLIITTELILMWVEGREGGLGTDVRVTVDIKG